jgi:hypothetical protein
VTVYRIDRWIQQGLTWSLTDLDSATLEALETLWAERQRVEREQLERMKRTGGSGEVY